MQFKMHESEAFKKEKKACDAYLGGADPYTPAGSDKGVYLIFRVNHDEASMATIFSLDYRDEARTGYGGVSPAVRGKSGTQLGKGKVKYQTITKKAKKQGGGHAEEVFIRSLGKILKDLVEHKYKVTDFEVFISKIPCFKEGNIGSSAFILKSSDASWASSDTLYPEGCGPKLNLLAKTCSSINWAFCYEKDYAGTSVDEKTKKQMITLAGEKNASVFRYANDGRVHQVTVKV